MKKTILISLVLSILFAFCGCTDEEEPVVVTVMTEGDTLSWHEIKKDNIEIKVEVVPTGTLAEHFLAAETKPNIIYLKSKEGMELIKASLADVSDVELDGYDRAKLASPDYEETERRHASEDGNHYVLPDHNANRNYTERAWLYRKDVFDKLNLKTPATMNELLNVSHALKKEYKNSTPVALRDGYYGLDLVAPAWKKGASVGAYYDFEEKKWCYGLEEPWAGNFISYWANMYKAGLLPENYLTMDTKEIDELIGEDKVFMIPDYVWKIEYYKEKHPEQDWQVMPAPRADIPTGQNKIAKREAPFAGVAICKGSGAEYNAALLVIDEYFMNSHIRKLPKSKNARLAEVYTDDNINPARYAIPEDSVAKGRVATHLEGVLPAFLYGEIPMKRWEAFAAQLSEKGTKDLLSEYKREYSTTKK